MSKECENDKIKNVYIYFNGYRQGSFFGFIDAIEALKFWLDPVFNHRIFDPITIVIK